MLGHDILLKRASKEIYAPGGDPDFTGEYPYATSRACFVEVTSQFDLEVRLLVDTQHSFLLHVQLLWKASAYKRMQKMGMDEKRMMSRYLGVLESRGVLVKQSSTDSRVRGGPGDRVAIPSWRAIRPGKLRRRPGMRMSW